MYTESNTKVEIIHNTNGDTRTADHLPTMTEFNNANDMHRNDVQKLIKRFCTLLQNSAKNHDWTKVREPYRSMFYRDLIATLEERMAFMEGEWANLHYNELERHHLAQHTPEDVDMFDIIEMICDCVAAGMARSGEVYPVEISNETFQLALQNTVELLKNEIEITETDSE